MHNYQDYYNNNRIFNIVANDIIKKENNKHIEEIENNKHIKGIENNKHIKGI